MSFKGLSYTIAAEVGFRTGFEELSDSVRAFIPESSKS
jgi:hypothetical protein